MHYLLIITLFFQIGFNLSGRTVATKVQQMRAERKPFQKSSATLNTPTKYVKRETKTGTYDPKPKVVLVDEKSGKYELRWIGYDGKEKIINYQRMDSIDALVEARIIKNSEASLLTNT